MRPLLLFLALSATPLVATPPQVRLAESVPGLEIEQPPQAYEARRLVGDIAVPPGVVLKLKRIRPLTPPAPRHLVPPSSEIRVVDLQEAGKYGLQTLIEKWHTLIESGDPAQAGPLRDRPRISEIPWMNASRLFNARVRFHTFPWGKAVLFITSYAQSSVNGPVNNDMLTLVVQGLTNDGRYAVNARLELRHPELPESTWDRGAMRIDIMRNSSQTEEWLERQPDDAFRPAITDYLRLLEGLQIGDGAATE